MDRGCSYHKDGHNITTLENNYIKQYKRTDYVPENQNRNHILMVHGMIMIINDAEKIYEKI